MQRHLRGQIWWCNCSYDVNSSERELDTKDKQRLFNHIQNGIRPVVIISNDTGNKHSETLQVIPCTTAERNLIPTHCIIYIDKRKNTVLCEQTRTINKSDLTHYIATLDGKEMQQIEECIQIALGLKTAATHYEKINIK